MDDYKSCPLSHRERARVRDVEQLKMRARVLRQHATDTERLLWRYLRGRQFLGYKFRRQVVIEPYIVDFVCFEVKLIIELDDGQHIEQTEYDCLRTMKLEAMGFRVLRFGNHDVLVETESVLESIRLSLVKTALSYP